MDYMATAYLEGAQYVLTRLKRLTALRGLLEDAPVKALIQLTECLINGEPFVAADHYHSLSHALLTGEYRRVSGSLWQDYICFALIERENAFSRSAARGEWDEPLCAAMRQDMKLLGALLKLSSSALKKWLGECHQDAKTKPRSQKDSIAIMSSAVWSGGTSRPLPKPSPEKDQPAAPSGRLPASLDENEFISWRYRIEQAEDAYDTPASEELCERILAAPDLGALLDDMWNFHATCGSGRFVSDRIFYINAHGGLSPIQLTGEPDAYTLYQDQREREMKNAIRFMQGEHADNMLITGGSGTGKTMQIFALARELPELRLVCCPPGRITQLIHLMDTLTGQPFKIAILLDDFDPGDTAWPQLRCEIAPGSAQPENLLLFACARVADDAFFPLKIHLPAPQLKEFIELVQLILLQQGRDIDFDSIQNACIDYAASVGANGGSPLSFRSAGVIARTML